MASLFYSSAQADAIPYTGVWEGAIGVRPIKVCFAVGDSQYYYIDDRHGIVLSSQEGSTPFSAWQESIKGSPSTEAGSWREIKVVGNTLEGDWSNASETTKLKIRLNKIAELTPAKKGPYPPCGSAYFKPILNAAPQNKNLTAYQLPNNYMGASRFNAHVRHWLEDQAVEAYECMMNSGNDRAIDFAPEVLTDKILVIRETLFDVYCGGNHNVSGTSHYVFDPRTGDSIDTFTWIRDGQQSVEPPPDNTPASQLRSLIEKMNPATNDGGCNNEFDVAPPFPTKEGFEFPTRYGWAARVCDSSVLIPFKNLSPFLTLEGKKVAKSLTEP